MFKLYFKDGDRLKQLIYECNSIAECFKAIKDADFLDTISYYQRVWCSDRNTMTVDFGSHYQFFYIEYEGMEYESIEQAFIKEYKE